MIFCVIFEDNEEHADMRPRHMSAHLEFLRKNANSIEAAGPLVDTEGNVPAGGMWLVRTDTAEHVGALVAADPFWPTGLRKSVRILQWNQVFSSTK